MIRRRPRRRRPRLRRQAVGDQRPRSAARASKRTALRKRSCDLGYDTGCVSYADDLLAGREGVPKNAAGGARILATTCDASDKSACEKLIGVYKNNEDLEDPAKADAVKARACQRGVKLYSCNK